MKFTITRTNKQNKLMVSAKTIDSFLERIAKDDSKQSVTNFRMSVPLMEGDYQFYKGIEQWQHVYPAAEFGKDESDNLVFKKSNGLLMLHFTNLTTGQDMEAARKAARLLPMTLLPSPEPMAEASSCSSASAMRKEAHPKRRLMQNSSISMLTNRPSRSIFLSYRQNSRKKSQP